MQRQVGVISVTVQMGRDPLGWVQVLVQDLGMFRTQFR